MKKATLLIASIIFWVLFIVVIILFIKNKNEIPKKIENKPIEEILNIEETVESKEDIELTQDNNSIQINNRVKNYTKNKNNFIKNEQYVYVNKDQYDQLFSTLLWEKDWNLDGSKRKINVSDYVSTTFLEKYQEGKNIIEEFINLDFNPQMEFKYDVYDQSLIIFINVKDDIIYPDWARLHFKFDYILEDNFYKIDDIYLVSDSRINNPLYNYTNIVYLIESIYKNIDKDLDIPYVGKEFWEKYANGKFLGNLGDIYEISTYIDKGSDGNDIEQYCNVKIKIYDKDDNKFKWKYYKISYELNGYDEISNIDAKLIRTTVDSTNTNIGPLEENMNEEN